MSSPMPAALSQNDIVPLNSGMRGYVAVLRQELASETHVIVRDPKRPDFYTIGGSRGGFYVHVHLGRLYLVHYAPPASSRASPGREGSSPSDARQPPRLAGRTGVASPTWGGRYVPFARISSRSSLRL
jgi:hypothetical protein